jgi:hypothetical protein
VLRSVRCRHQSTSALQAQVIPTAATHATPAQQHSVVVRKPLKRGFLRFWDCYTMKMSDCASAVMLTVPIYHSVSERGAEMDSAVACYAAT